jgi:hypothetical protein
MTGCGAGVPGGSCVRVQGGRTEPKWGRWHSEEDHRTMGLPFLGVGEGVRSQLLGPRGLGCLDEDREELSLLPHECT